MGLAVHIKDTLKVYGDFKAVNHITLDIKGGEFFTLLGPSGCGKTTLLRMIAGFNDIDGGEIFFDDRLINNIPAHRRNIGMVFQNYAIFPHMTVADNVAYGLTARGIKGEEAKKKVLTALELMHIANLKDRTPSQLSGGQQQRVALARAIVIEPDVLLMDEPLSNLDAKLRLAMRTSIRKLQQDLGITTIYVTHDQEEALAISDRIAVMKSGSVMQMGTPTEIYTHPANDFVADFIGTSNFLTGTSTGNAFDVLGVLSFNRPLKNGYIGAIKISLRPEEITLVPAGDSPLRGVIETVTYLGTNYEYEVRLNTNAVLTDGDEPVSPLIIVKNYNTRLAPYALGETVGIKISQDSMNIYSGNGEEALL